MAASSLRSPGLAEGRPHPAWSLLRTPPTPSLSLPRYARTSRRFWSGKQTSARTGGRARPDPPVRPLIRDPCGPVSWPAAPCSSMTSRGCRGHGWASSRRACCPVPPGSPTPHFRSCSPGSSRGGLRLWDRPSTLPPPALPLGRVHSRGQAQPLQQVHPCPTQLVFGCPVSRTFRAPM